MKTADTFFSNAKESRSAGDFSIWRTSEST
uniref:Uncharacterized protein n=1 Tax=Arundo donax TaxID=35708 RepID=A0A0A9C9M0_ARUDO